MNITLDNIEEFKVPLEDYISKWIFTDQNKELASKEHQDQIFPLTKEAANYLWDFEMKHGIQCTEKFYKSIKTFDSALTDQQTIKKYLYNLGIPFSQKVFIAQQPNTAFVLTWKMVIKYSHNLFRSYDQVVRDKTMNWLLEFHHDGEFTFGKDFIYDGQLETLKNNEKLQTNLKEMLERKNRHNLDRNW